MSTPMPITSAFENPGCLEASANVSATTFSRLEKIVARMLSREMVIGFIEENSEVSAWIVDDGSC